MTLLWKPKVCGGLSFKDLILFNQALLTKQAWHILMFLNNLSSRLLQAKYLRKATFLGTSTKARAFMVWKGIIWGQQLSQKGLRMRIGYGRTTYIATYPWIPKETTFKLVMSSGALDSQIAVFINHDVKKGI